MLPRISKSITNKESLNKFLQRHEHNGHLARLSESRSLVSISSASYSKPKHKKLCYPDKIRRREIRFENKRLLKSITDIIKKNVIQIKKERKRSLNGLTRKKELIRITKENHAILRRLEKVKSFNFSKRLEAKSARRSIKANQEYVSIKNLNKPINVPELLESISENDEILNTTMMSKCNVSQKKLIKYENTYHFIEVIITNGKLKIIVKPFSGKESFTTNFSLKQSI